MRAGRTARGSQLDSGAERRSWAAPESAPGARGAAVISAFAVVLAQSCAALLPPPAVQIDWSRNGQPYARDVPVSSSATERVYRRSFRNSQTEDVTRVLSCAPSAQGIVLQERVGADDVSIPVELRRAQTISLNGATIRRIDAPADAPAGGLWFSVS